MADTKFKMNDEVVVAKGFHRGMKFKLTDQSPASGRYWGEYTGKWWEEDELELANAEKPTITIKTKKSSLPWYRRLF